jgi:ornithine cyclodeaminase
LIFLDATATRRALPMSDAIESMRDAFAEDVEMPLRTQLGSSLFMPGRVGDVSGVKVVSVVPGNPVGIVAIFDGNGNALGLVDGPTLTAIRTGAVAGLATSLLASKSAARLAMLGAGAMAYDQIEAIRCVRELEDIVVWSRNSTHAANVAERVGGRVVDDPDVAVANADIVSCATPATTPLFRPDSVGPGTHINAVGAFRPDMVEVPSETVNRAFVVVDDYEAAAAEAGDLIQADREPNASISQLLMGNHPSVGEDVTFFKSVGVSSQDVAAGHRALANAAELEIGLAIR